MDFDFANIIHAVAHYAGPGLLALAALLIGRMISRKISTAAEKTFNRAPNANLTVSRFFASLIRYCLIFITIMIALGILGVDTSAVGAAVLGLGAALAFILKDSLGDLAAGVMLVLMRPFSIGDEVKIDGVSGVVTDIGLLATRLKTPGDIEIIIANGKAWNGVIRNYSAFGKRRLDTVFRIGFDNDIDNAIAVIKSVASQDERVYQDPAPWAKVVDIGESSVGVELRVWCDSSAYRALKVSLPQPIKQALETAGIPIPYPVEIKLKKKTNRSHNRARTTRSKPLSNNS